MKTIHFPRWAEVLEGSDISSKERDAYPPLPMACGSNPAELSSQITFLHPNLALNHHLSPCV